jgi:DNA-binding NarL/FixJ family response regulator
VKKVSVFLVDDHQLVRDGIKWQFNKSNNIEVTGEAGDGVELFEKLKLSVPDIIILEISLPKITGIELTKAITANYPGIKVLILSNNHAEDFIFESLKAGAAGFISKNTTRKELLEAITRIYNGYDFLGESISEKIVKGFIKRARSGEDYFKKKEINLTSREIEILKLVANGAGNKEIADKLFISIRTVGSHKNHIMQKLEVDTPVDLIKFAIKNKLIDIQ